MPLKKVSSISTTSTISDLEPPTLNHTAELPKKEPPKHEIPMTKDDYWRRREERDIEKEAEYDARHRRNLRGDRWDAALQSTGILSFANVQDLAGYLAAVAKAAEEGLKFVESK